MNFSEQFRRKVLEIDGLSDVVPQPRYDSPKLQEKVVPLFDLYKSWIPYGVGESPNRLIASRLERAEADLMTIRLIRKEQQRRDDGAGGIFFSYEIVPMDATALQRSAFYNEGSPVCE